MPGHSKQINKAVVSTKLWSVHTMDHHSVVDRNELLTCVWLSHALCSHLYEALEPAKPICNDRGHNSVYLWGLVWWKLHCACVEGSSCTLHVSAQRNYLNMWTLKASSTTVTIIHQFYCVVILINVVLSIFKFSLSFLKLCKVWWLCMCVCCAPRMWSDTKSLNLLASCFMARTLPLSLDATRGGHGGAGEDTHPSERP